MLKHYFNERFDRLGQISLSSVIHTMKFVKVKLAHIKYRHRYIHIYLTKRRRDKARKEQRVNKTNKQTKERFPLSACSFTTEVVDKRNVIIVLVIDI